MEPTISNRVVLAGGSGFLGQALATKLDQLGYEVVVLTRRPKRHPGAGRPVYWDGKTVDSEWAKELEGAKGLVNLAGKPVNCRQTKANRDAIIKSRIEPTIALGEALRLVFRVPEVWVQAGSLAIYGNAGDRLCDESAFVPDEYPTDVCVAWEEALGQAVRPEMRWAMLRIGFVLGNEGGALPTLARLARLGFGGRIGNGKQWISWIHRDDMVRFFVEAIENPHIHGIYNASGLQPVTNDEFMRTVRKTLGIPAGLPTPRPLMKAVAPIVGADPDLALNGRRGLPVRMHGHGFPFHYHNLEDALADLLKAPAPRPVRATNRRPKPLAQTEWAKTPAR